jgi:hypothetical protein
MSRRLAIALVHHPALDREGNVVTTALTNMDVHDMARSARSYGCSDYYVVHPIEAARTMVGRIVDHWTFGSSAVRIPDRKDALSIVRTVGTLDDAIAAHGAASGGVVETWVTTALEIGTTMTFEAARARLATEGPPVLLLFGSGWGLGPDATRRATHVIEPIYGPGAYNHLSVRSACAISLDRLRGR